MSVDFFETGCKEPARIDDLFGICDDQNGTKAYTDVQNTNKWIATVKNDNRIEVVFTAIDNCITILKEGTNDKESSCDGLLLFGESIYLVELKKKETVGWLRVAIGKLKNTIKFVYAKKNLKKLQAEKIIQNVI